MEGNRKRVKKLGYILDSPGNRTLTREKERLGLHWQLFALKTDWMWRTGEEFLEVLPENLYPMVKTQHFHCCGPGTIPNRELRS